MRCARPLPRASYPNSRAFGGGRRQIQRVLRRRLRLPPMQRLHRRFVVRAAEHRAAKQSPCSVSCFYNWWTWRRLTVRRCESLFASALISSDRRIGWGLASHQTMWCPRIRARMSSLPRRASQSATTWRIVPMPMLCCGFDFES